VTTPVDENKATKKGTTASADVRKPIIKTNTKVSMQRSITERYDA
jgi:hypothetical protein